MICYHIKMRKLISIVLVVVVGLVTLYFYGRFRQPKEVRKNTEKKVSPSLKQIDNTVTVSKSIFVPYWSINQESLDFSEYDEVIYFGIAPSRQGINRQEEGYIALEKFISSVSEVKKKYLTLRMIDDEINSFILNNKNIQKKIIDESLNILTEKGFSGLVLDLEISNILNKDITDQINVFVQTFYTTLNKDYRKFYLALYGDTFYRKRPFDLKHISRNSDGILIMAYDFHKSRGEPGPNFPYESGAKYQYNFKTMISDFLQFVPKEKLTVIYGMFGYNWLVDEKKRPIRQAEALSLNEIKKKFIMKCEFKNCIIKRDKISQETEINYIISSSTPDELNIYRIDYHIVWFEDEESVKVKTEYLKEQGIGSVSYWASGYF